MSFNSEKVKLNEDLISVIVPVYNVEKHLRDCLDCICNQTYRNLEILLIDDGSTDSSGLLCDEYAKDDKRIKVFHQSNEGLSSARNKGLDNMNGSFVVFMDSDDLIAYNMIERLYTLLCDTNCDISCCGFQSIYGNEKKRKTIFKTVRVLSGNQKYDELYYNWRTVVQWNKLFRKKIFDDLRFPVGKYHEDEFVIHREFNIADKIVFTNEILYYYYQNDDGIVLNPSARKRYDACLAFIDRINFYRDKGMMNNSALEYLKLRYIVNECLKENYSDSDIYFPKIKEILSSVDKDVVEYNYQIRWDKQLFSRIRNLMYLLEGELRKSKDKK